MVANTSSDKASIWYNDNSTLLKVAIVGNTNLRFQE